jgi:hypothetical protein
MAITDRRPNDLLILVTPLPDVLVEQYSSLVEAECDVDARLEAARQWRLAADEAALGHPPAQAAQAFLHDGCVLGIPVPVVPGCVYGLRPGRPADRRSAAEAFAAATARLRDDATGHRYQEGVCLVPAPAERRLPSYAGAVDLATGAPARTLRLPMVRRPLSRLGRGVLLLFEAQHAMRIRSIPVSANVGADWEAEAALHIFEFGLLGRFDGYRDAVEVYGDRLARAGDLLARPGSVLSRRQRRALAEPFGRIDDEELHLWASVAYRNAIYLTFGRDVGTFAAHLRAQAAARRS